MSIISDKLCPDYFGEEGLSVSLDTQGTLLAGSPVSVIFSYDDIGNRGVIPPIDVYVKHIKRGSIYSHKKTFTRTIPEGYTFKAGDSGQYLITIRERYHNGAWGRLIINVLGDQYNNVLAGGRR